MGSRLRGAREFFAMTKMQWEGSKFSRGKISLEFVWVRRGTSIARLELMVVGETHCGRLVGGGVSSKRNIVPCQQCDPQPTLTTSLIGFQGQRWDLSREEAHDVWEAYSIPQRRTPKTFCIGGFFSHGSFL